VTKKALRYYDKVGILSPEKVAGGSGYRYYSKKNLLSVPIIKYYKQSGFKLDEMKEFLEGANYDFLDKSFRRKIDELTELDREINLKRRSLKDWYDLIVEAQMVIENNVCDVAIKYINDCKLIYLEQDFNYDYMESIINLEFNNYVESINNAITGPVILNFSSFRDKIDGKCEKVRIMQQAILKCEESKCVELKGCMVASCYHIGTHDTIGDTYKKIVEWTEERGYVCSNESYERYVTDYWTTKSSDKFVTEILIGVKRKN
jgi:DNA-binding transcriptional MerR regulator